MYINMLRQVNISSFVKGGSLIISCGANTISSLMDVFTRYPDFSILKNVLIRSGEISFVILDGKIPFLAFSMATKSKSVAKIWSLIFFCFLIFSRASSKTIAREYASSPVEQAETQTRMVYPFGNSFSRFGIISSLSLSQTAVSRKKLVTPINNSLKSNSTSFGFSCKKRT